MKKTLFFLFAFILVSCGPVTPISPPTTNPPIIKFETPNLFDGTESDANFDLNVGIFAVDKNVLFLFGSIGEFSDYPLQSTILRSEDGGKHWIEVMKPEQISRVVEFQMLENGIGWALILSNGGRGPLALFHTTDFGKSWAKLTEIPKNTNLGFPIFMYFGSKNEGQIDIAYPYEPPGKNYIVHLSTNDGGKTWEETGRYYPKFENEYSQYSITHAYTKNKKDYSESISLNGESYWKLENFDDKIIINLKLPKIINDSSGFPEWQDWKTINTLPLHLNYENGMIKFQ